MCLPHTLIVRGLAELALEMLYVRDVMAQLGFVFLDRVWWLFTA